jgi:hypothetical protein
VAHTAIPSSHVKAAWAFHIHEKTIGALHQALELVLLLLVGSRGVKKILHLHIVTGKHTHIRKMLRAQLRCRAAHHFVRWMGLLRSRSMAATSQTNTSNLPRNDGVRRGASTGARKPPGQSNGFSWLVWRGAALFALPAALWQSGRAGSRACSPTKPPTTACQRMSSWHTHHNAGAGRVRSHRSHGIARLG